MYVQAGSRERRTYGTIPHVYRLLTSIPVLRMNTGPMCIYVCTATVQ